jgi:uncharacterized protein
MLAFKQPGIYTREFSSGVRTITGASTSVALFIGPTKIGIDNRPIRILNYSDFERKFGGLSPTSNLSYSVLHFFANGGGEAYIQRLPAVGAVPASTTLTKFAAPAVASTKLTALSSGLDSNEIFVELDPFGIDAKPFAGSNYIKTIYNLSIIDRVSGQRERFSRLTTIAGQARTAPNVVNDVSTGSQLVSLTALAPGGEAPKPTGTIVTIARMALGNAATPTVDKPLKTADGTFGRVISLRLELKDYNASGAAQDLLPTSSTPASIPIFAAGALPPQTPLELTRRMASAINEWLRDPARGFANPPQVAVDLGDLGAGFRISVIGPSASGIRGSDAKVVLTRRTSGVPNTDFDLMEVFDLTLVSTNVSRYRLGTTYDSSVDGFSAAAPGIGGSTTELQPDSEVFKKAVATLDVPDPFFNILVLSDAVRASASDPATPVHANHMTIYQEGARVCALKHAFLLIDPPPNVTTIEAAESWKSTKVTFQSSHAAAFFPGIRVDDPLEPGAIRSHPPSGAIAGVIARTDSGTGVWRAPAGTEAFLAGVYGPTLRMSDDEHGILNPIGLNCIRQFPIFNTVSFGSRTLDGADAAASEWKYIPPRRTASFILRSLSEGLRWAVHQPNGEELWSQLRLNVSAFMQGLYRQGAFKGTSPRDAYFVKCDGETTTAADINLGIVNIVVGFAPLKPAEFVVINLRQIVQAQS